MGSRETGNPVRQLTNGFAIGSERVNEPMARKGPEIAHALSPPGPWSQAAERASFLDHERREAEG